MARRKQSLPKSEGTRTREQAEEDEAFSKAASALIERALSGKSRKKPPAYVGSGVGPSDLGRRAEEYLREYFASR